MKTSILREKAKNFAKEIIALCLKLRENKVDFAIVSQVIRAGTSIGANIHEAMYAQSVKDFVSKLHIALKECSETAFWLELLHETGLITETEGLRYSGMCSEIEWMLISSIKTSKKKIPEQTKKEDNA